LLAPFSSRPSSPPPRHGFPFLIALWKAPLTRKLLLTGVAIFLPFTLLSRAGFYAAKPASLCCSPLAETPPASLFLPPPSRNGNRYFDATPSSLLVELAPLLSRVTLRPMLSCLVCHPALLRVFIYSKDVSPTVFSPLQQYVFNDCERPLGRRISSFRVLKVFLPRDYTTLEDQRAFFLSLPPGSVFAAFRQCFTVAFPPPARGLFSFSPSPPNLQSPYEPHPTVPALPILRVLLPPIGFPSPFQDFC